MPEDKLIRNTAAVSLATSLATVVAVATTIVIVVRFGFSGQADVYFLAIVVPRVIQSILHRTAPQVLIAVLTDEAQKGGEAAAAGFLRQLLTWVGACGLGLYALLLAAMGPVTNLLAPGLAPENAALALTVFRLIFVGVALVPLCELLIAFLNHRGVFGRPAGAELFRSSVVLAALVFAPREWGLLAIAWAYFFGFVIQTVALAVWSRQEGLSLVPQFSGKSTAMHTFFSGLAFPAVGATLNFAPTVLQRALASLLAPGVVTAFSVTQQIVGTLFVIGLRAVDVAGRPQIARYAAARQFDAMNAFLDRSLVLATLTGTAAYAFTTALAPDIVGAAVLTDALNPETGQLLVGLLLILACSLPLDGNVHVLRSPHYALHQSRIPGMQMAVMGIAHVGFIVVLFQLFQAYGLVLAHVVWVAASLALAVVWRPEPCAGVARRIARPVVALLVACGMTAALVLLVRPQWLARYPFEGIALHAASATTALAGAALIVTLAAAVVWPGIRAPKS